MVDDVRRKLRWCALECGADCIQNRHHRVCQRFAHLIRVQHHVLWQTVHQVASLDFHRLFILVRISRANLNLDVLSGAVTDEQVIFFLNILDDCRIKFVSAHSDRTGSNDAAQRNHCALAGAAADIDDHAAGCLCYRQSGTDCCCHRLFDDGNMASTCLQRSLLNRSAFYCGNAGWNTDDHTRTGKDGVVARFFDENLEHTCGDVKVRNDAILQRSYCNDRTRGPADNILGLLADIFYGIISGIHRYDRWLTHDDALTLHKYQGICGTQIDSNIFSEHNFSSCQSQRRTLFPHLL